MEIGEPSLLFKLPKPGIFEHGGTVCSQVYGVSTGSKKKRHELCVAVDGNSASIIEAVNGKPLTSFTVPPDAAFVSKPCALHTRPSVGHVRRTIICALRRRDELSVSRFVENNVGDQSSSQSFKHKLEDEYGPVAFLDGSDDETGHVTVLQESGRLSLLPNAGPKEARISSLISSHGALVVLAAEQLSLDEAASTVFCSRPDILSTIPVGSKVLCVVYQTKDGTDIRFGVWATSNLTSILSQTLATVLDHSLNLDLGKFGRSKLRYSFQHNASSISIETPERRVAIDITQVLPKVNTEYVINTTETQDAVTIAGPIVLAMTQRSLRLVNAKFGSVLASLDMGSIKLKRKRNKSNFVGSSSFVAYFPKLKRVVMSRANQLLAIDLQSSSKSGSLQQSSLLLANIGRGIHGNNDYTREHTSNNQSSEVPDKEWRTVSQQLDNYALTNSVTEFESLYIQNVSEDSRSLPKDASTIPQFKLDYLFSKIFRPSKTISDASAGQVHAVFLPKNLIKWCAREGLLTRQSLQRVWQSSATTSGVPNTQTEPLSLTLTDVDESYDLLNYCLRECPYLEVRDLIATIQVLLRKALSPTSASASQLMIDIGQSEVVEADRELRIAQSSDGWPADRSQKNETILEHLNKTLVNACRRLAQSGYDRVFTKMRTCMNSTDALTLVQFLRQQLFKSGYTRLLQSQNYPTPPPSSNENELDYNFSQSKSTDELSLADTVTLLMLCIDCLGPVGLLTSQEGDDDFNANLIQDLLSEITRATETLEESAYFRGILRETLRYTESVDKQHPSLRQDLLEDRASVPQPGTITTLYSESYSEEIGSLTQTSLPLGLRADEDFGKRRIRKGGGNEVERSSREIGMLRDRQRPAYSFERLIL